MASPATEPVETSAPGPGEEQEERLVDRVSVGGQLYATSQLQTNLYSILQLLPEYGWYLLLALVVAVLVWIQLRHHVYAWLKRRQQVLEEQNFDPVKAEKYQDAMLLARERMQRVQDEKAKEHQEQELERKEEDRNERIRQWETFQVVTTKSKKPKSRLTDTGRFPSRREYFPLDGAGGGGGYRPARRYMGGGG